MKHEADLEDGPRRAHRHFRHRRLVKGSAGHRARPRRKKLQRNHRSRRRGLSRPQRPLRPCPQASPRPAPSRPAVCAQTAPLPPPTRPQTPLSPAPCPQALTAAIVARPASITAITAAAPTGAMAATVATAAPAMTGTCTAPRYRVRRPGYTYHYAGYWYSAAWWVPVRTGGYGGGPWRRPSEPQRMVFRPVRRLLRCPHQHLRSLRRPQLPLHPAQTLVSRERLADLRGSAGAKLRDAPAEWLASCWGRAWSREVDLRCARQPASVRANYQNILI